MLTRLSTYEITRGKYRGVNFEIAHPHDDYNFCYYLFLNLEYFEDKELADSLWINAEDSGFGRKITPYHKNEFLAGLEMHGGITFYSKMFNGEDKRIIKIGCDYGHLWDEYQWYTVEDVATDVKSTIDDLHAKTTVLMYCGGDGRLVKESEGEYRDDGNFVSHGYLMKKESELNANR